MPDIVVTVRRSNGQQMEVKIEMPNTVFARFLEIARRRNQPVGEIFGEALRLEQLFDDALTADDKSLIFRQGDNYQELASV